MSDYIVCNPIRKRLNSSKSEHCIMRSHDNKADTDAINLLSEGQRLCLRLVAEQMSSKEIALELGISPHTVDQRLKVATRILRVHGRVEAARMLAAHERRNPYQFPYQSLVHQTPGVEPADKPIMILPVIDERELPPSDIDRDRIPGRLSISFLPQTPVSRTTGWPLPLYEGEKNELSYAYRLGWIFAIAAISALAFGMILAGLDALARLV